MSIIDDTYYRNADLELHAGAPSIPFNPLQCMRLPQACLAKREITDVSDKPQAPMHNFSSEMEKALREAGWFPGRKTYEELEKFDFALHELGRNFIVEFGGLLIANYLFVTAYIPNLEVRRIMKGFVAMGLNGCAPVARSNYYADSSMWIGEDGKAYLADDIEILMAGETVDEGMEVLALGKKIPPSYPKWNVESYYD